MTRPAPGRDGRPAGRAALLRGGERPLLQLPGRQVRELLGRGSPSGMTVRLVEVAEEPTGTSARPLHRHPDVAELIWVLEGRGALLGPDGRELDVVPGEAVVVPAGRPHRMAAEGGRLRLLCVFPTGALETRDLEP